MVDWIGSLDTSEVYGGWPGQAKYKQKLRFFNYFLF